MRSAIQIEARAQIMRMGGEGGGRGRGKNLILPLPLLPSNCCPRFKLCVAKFTETLARKVAKTVLIKKSYDNHIKR